MDYCPMDIETVVLNDKFEIIFQGTTTINSEALIEVAKPRRQIAEQKGEKWTRGAIPFYGGELIKKVQAGEIGDEIDKAAMEVAMVAWLYDSIFLRTDKKVFKSHSLRFTMYPGGAVEYTKL